MLLIYDILNLIDSFDTLTNLKKIKEATKIENE